MTQTVLPDAPRIDRPAGQPASAADLWALVRRAAKPLTSLKLTVTLFAMAIFLVIAGTFAQVDQDVWQVTSLYFRLDFSSIHALLTSCLPWIDFQIFFPASFFPSRPQIPGGIWFPNGWLIGMAMFVNLLAAHLVRFKVQAGLWQARVGWALVAAGLAVTVLVVASSSTADGVQGAAIDFALVWALIKIASAALFVATAWGFISLVRSGRCPAWLGVVAGLTAVATSGVLAWILLGGQAARPSDAALRILWQLGKACLAGCLLLPGCLLVFKRRGGIVQLHLGILVLMLGELVVGLSAVEGQMHISEGQTVNYVQDIRRVELAIIDRSDPQFDDVVVVPQSLLRRSWRHGTPIRDERLACDLQVVRYMEHSRLRPQAAGDDNPATTGAGLVHVAEPARSATGTDTGGAVDMASAYVKLVSKSGGQDLGTRLVSQHLPDQPVTIGAQVYDLALRFKRTYKPYAIHLLDVRKADYIGTNTPKDYSSHIRITDATRGVDRPVRIWMNNPLRFAGETFYQANYVRDPATGTETTGLQVVTNAGRMLPYLGWGHVAMGMVAHFTMTLMGFLRRNGQAAAAAQRSNPADSARPRTGSQAAGPARLGRLVPFLAVGAFAAWLVAALAEPKVAEGQMDLDAFGKLPLVYEGRVKPFDTLARNSLRITSDRQRFLPADSDRKASAIRWLLDMLAKPQMADRHPVFKIHHMGVLDLLGLQRRKGNLYAIDEFRAQADAFNEQAEQARVLRRSRPEDLSLYQRKILKLAQKIRLYTLVQRSFQPVRLPPLPGPDQFEQDPDGATATIRRIKALLVESADNDRMLASMHAPRAVPVPGGQAQRDDQVWIPYTTAWTQAYTDQVQGLPVNPATASLEAILVAYARDDASLFNQEVASYQAQLEADPPLTSISSGQRLDDARVRFEAYFNHVGPFMPLAFFYLVAFVLAASAWLGWPPLNRAAFWLIGVTLAVHSLALIGRIYISGRPPVTNLYGSAVFIGWATVALGLLMEAIFKGGFGNIAASTAGFATLLIAHFLAGDGDTFTVLIAVLDTQFWLATHVVCITLGYATTGLAGLLGIVYILGGVCSPSLTAPTRKTLAQMIYGIVCFSIFFSFVGTVLGGLWADDSWGRFWGWDPKENGALIIVLFNALVLHARWGGMIRQRGLAVLATGGLIAVCWSWFGVNELGVGLHSYGFTEGVLRYLLTAVVICLVIMLLAIAVPEDRWWSLRRDRST